MGLFVSCTDDFLQTSSGPPYSSLRQVVLVVGSEHHDSYKWHKRQCELFDGVAQYRRWIVLVHGGSNSRILEGVDVFVEMRD